MIMSADLFPNIECRQFANIAVLLQEEGGREMLEAAITLTEMRDGLIGNPPLAPPPAPAQEVQPTAQPASRTRAQKRARESVVNVDSNEVEDVKPPKKKSKKEDTQKITSNSSHKRFAEYVASFPEFPKNVSAEARKQAFLDDPSVAEIVNERQLRCAGCYEIRNLDGVYMINNWTKHHKRCKKLFENWLDAQPSS